MPRKPLLLTDEIVYHVYARTNNRDFFLDQRKEVWRLMTESLLHYGKEQNVRFHAFVLMSNHYHLMVSTPERNLGDFMRNWSTNFVRRFNFRFQRENHFFGGRYKSSYLTTPLSYAHCLKYCLRNPIDAGICERAEDYPFSTVQENLRRRSLFPLSEPPQGLATDFEGLGDEWLSWVNEAYEEWQRESVRRALQRREFQLAADPACRGRKIRGL